MTGTHQITMQIRVDGDGCAWSGVGVCLDCQPDTNGGRSPRRTFTHGQPCPRCGGPGVLEWRRTPMFDAAAGFLRN